MDEPRRLHLFEGYGIELEYMIVDAETLDVRPISDRLLRAAAASEEFVSDVELGDIAWSNELVLHVVELKTNGPARSLEPLPEAFDKSLGRLRSIAATEGARILGTGMHPWMDPMREMKLWPHENNPVYQAFNRIFDCRGHGWANLQSMHINLPFADDAEFRLLHGAIRLLLPILPALSASSPIAGGAIASALDQRMVFYKTNAAKMPSMTGRVVPEPVYTRAEYERRILGRIYDDLAAHDPEGVLQEEFANARGAIARFDRYAIEIRVLDVQECPKADLAIAAAAAAVLRFMIEGRFDLGRALDFPVEPLAAVLDDVIRDADRATIADGDYLALFGLSSSPARSARDVWRHLLDRAPPDSAHAPSLSCILDQGPLARRILRRLPPSDPKPSDLLGVYRALLTSLEKNEMFE